MDIDFITFLCEEKYYFPWKQHKMIIILKIEHAQTLFSKYLTLDTVKPHGRLQLSPWKQEKIAVLE